MAIKILISGVSGSGKTSLLSTLGEETFVVSRDAKEFTLPIPHYLVDKYYDMKTFLYGSTITDEEGNTTVVEGVADKIHKYKGHYGKYPQNVAIDSVSQIFMDVIDKAAQTPNVYGSQGAEVTKEIALLVTFIHEQLELNGMNVILLNHVIAEKVDGKPTSNFISFGSGKFLDKGAWYSTTSEALLLAIEGNNRVVYTKGVGKQARSIDPNIPEKIYVENLVDPSKSRKLKDDEEYFNLKNYIKNLLDSQTQVKKFAL